MSDAHQPPDRIAPSQSDEAAAEVARLRQRVAELEQRCAAADRALDNWRLYSNALPLNVWTTEPDGSNLVLNRHFYEYTGLTAPATEDPDWLEIVHPDDRAEMNARWTEAFHKQQAYEIRLRLRSARGEYRWYLVRGLPVRDATGQLVKWVGASTDIHDEREYAERLREAETRLQTLLAAVPVMLWATDRNGTVIFCEGRPQVKFIPTPQQLVGTQVLQWSPQPDELSARIQRALAGEEVSSIVKVGDLSIDSRISPFRDEWGNVAGVIGVAADVTALKQTEESLRRAHDECEVRVNQRTADLERAVARLQLEERILRNLFNLQERERQVMAYELHDGLVQDVVAAKMLAESIDPRVTVDPAAIAGLVENVQRLLGSAIDEGRRLISDLRPLIIDEKGIVDAIHYLIVQEEPRGKTKLSFTHDTQFTRLPSLLEGSIFRITQEALANIRRHSQARSASIDLRQHGALLTLEIRDDGVGFDPSHVPANHFGLEGIRRRAELFGGKTAIDSRPGHGSTIRVEIPIPADDG